MPKADKTAKRTAPSKGLNPRKKARPIPPNEACVIPPLINTMRRETMYAPIIPHEILANTAAKNAF